MKEKITQNPFINFFLGVLILSGGLVGISLAFQGIRGGGDLDENTFASCYAMSEYIQMNSNDDKWGYPMPMPRMIVDSVDGAMPTGEFSENISDKIALDSSDISQTNNQVQGVEEADVIKTTDSAVFHISYNGVSVHKVEGEDLKIDFEQIETDYTPQNLFYSNGKLLVQSQQYKYDIGLSDRIDQNVTYFDIYDVMDLSDIQLIDTVAIQGSYTNSRMIGDKLFVLNTVNTNFWGKVAEEDILKSIPSVAIKSKGDDRFSVSPQARCNEISYFGDSVNSFVSIVTLDLSDQGSRVDSKLILGDSSNLYMSLNNLYLATTVYNSESADDFDEIINDDSASMSTEIFRISLDDEELRFDSKGMVPGTLLNQFSMDEHYDHLRVATTTGDIWGWSEVSKNNLYVLNQDMEITGSVEGLASGERIYSVRFMGDKGYMVTFREVDPLFVIDLSDNTNPQVLGELKIPGFSNYLHPYKTNFLIGIGQDVDESTGIQGGVKVALFDVTDPVNPVVKSELIFGESGSTTSVSRDHKAFMINSEKGYFAIPVDLEQSKNSFELGLIELLKDNEISTDKVYVSSPSRREGPGRIFSYEPGSRDLIEEYVNGKLNILSDYPIGFTPDEKIPEYFTIFESYVDEPTIDDTKGFILIGIDDDLNFNVISKVNFESSRSYEVGNSRSIYIGDTVHFFKENLYKSYKFISGELSSEIHLYR